MRPRLFWIDKIWCQWRDSSPVVNASVEQLVVTRRRKIGWRLDVHLWHKQACDCDRAHHLILRGLGAVSHGDFGLGAEILNNHFLNVSVAAVQLADREQC